MKRTSALVVLAMTIAIMIGLMLPVAAWTYQECVDVNFDHPHCDKYTTTTTAYQTTTTAEVTTTTAEVTTTTAEVTTTTEGEQTTTTVTVPEQTTLTTGPTTTIAECPPGTVHQPPLCIETEVIGGEASSSTVATVFAETAETLPFTGASTSSMVGLGAALAAGGAILLGVSRRAEEKRANRSWN